jgi:hypothetical protein
MEEACEKIDKIIAIVDGVNYEMVSTTHLDTDDK